MGLWVEIILLGIAFIAFAISGGFSTNAAVRVKSVPEYNTNKKLQDAHKWLTISAIITWISVALLLGGIIAAAFFAPEEFAATTAVGTEATSSVGKYVLYFLLFFVLGGVIAVGILSAIAANDIGSAKVANDNLSRRQAIIAASIAIGVFVLVLIALIVFLTRKPTKKTSSSASLISEFANDPTFMP